MRPALLACLLLSAGLSACATAEDLGITGARGQADLQDGGGRSVGVAWFSQGQYGAAIRLETTGLTPGWHGVHIHEHGVCVGPGFQSAGAHVKGYPAGESEGASEKPMTHGALSEGGGEFGDLPNLFVGADGVGRAEFHMFQGFLTNKQPGLLDADGSAIVIHAREDDQKTQPIGGSGERIACGVIKPAR